MSAIVTKVRLSRRAMLRGLGATMALPVLDAMTSAFTAAAQTPVRRIGAIYVPNGMNIWNWTPKTEGSGFDFSPILKPLEPFRKNLVVLSGLANKEADGRVGEGTGDHSRAQTAYLTGVHAKKTEGADIHLEGTGVSMDQIVARELGRETQLSSLELGLESNDLAGGCEDGYSCAYTGTIAWRSATTPLPIEANPRAVFERLFGASDSTDRDARLARLRKDHSILDAVAEEVNALQRKLGTPDQRKLSEYLDSVRDIERRIQMAEGQSNRELPVVQQPSGIPQTFEEYATLMFDLMALSYQTDLTRVVTFVIGREKSTRTYPEIGVPEPHHPVSHHQNRPDILDKQAKINTYHVKMFAHLLEKLQSVQDGDGSLLDHVMIVYGAGMSNSDIHFHHDLPVLVAGGGAGRVKGGQHIRVPRDTPMANLHLTLIEKMGVPIERFGDSEGKIELLAGV
jgi:Protein of unknown function (DUF1552)